MDKQRRRQVGALAIVLLVLTLVTAGFRHVRGRSTTPPVASSELADQLPLPIYALTPTPSGQLRDPQAVTRAVGFLSSMQPDGTYVLSRQGSPTVVPMDVAHAAIAFVSVDRIQSAEAAMTWLYQQITRPDSPDAVDANGVDYSGSWYDDLRTDGTPIEGNPRGRGESVGMALIATYSIYAQDPAYVTTQVGDARVIDLVRLSSAYLTRPTMQATDGRFFHSPEYRVAFNEEGARMTLGLRLASRMLEGQGDQTAAGLAASGAAAGLEALDRRTGLSQGMAYDYYARSIWGLATPKQAKQEMSWLRSTGLVGSYGVKNWDWQLTMAPVPLVWLHWWSQAQTVAPSQTFDYAIASVNAGDVATALDLEQRWLPLQRADGGFDDGFVFGPFGLHLGFGAPTSYSAARFILLEHLLTHVAGRSAAMQGLLL